MLNYEEELRKFKPSLEVDQIEEAVYKEDLTDMQDRMIEGKGTAKTIKLINEYIDTHEAQLLEIWEKAQNGEKIER